MSSSSLPPRDDFALLPFFLTRVLTLLSVAQLRTVASWSGLSTWQREIVEQHLRGAEAAEGAAGTPEARQP